jgi:hypothetical protein
MTNVKRVAMVSGIIIVLSGITALVDTAWLVLRQDAFVAGFYQALVHFAKSVTANFIFASLPGIVTALVVYLITGGKQPQKPTRVALSLAAAALFSVLAVTLSYESTSGYIPFVGRYLVCLALAAVSFTVGLKIGSFLNKRIYTARKPFNALIIVSATLVIALTFTGFRLPGPKTYDLERNEIAGPNVIIITIDALRRDFVSAYEKTHVTTPNIDRFAERGYRFENSFSNNPWTIPSMTTMLTGRYPSVHRVDAGTSLGDLPTLAEILKSHRYQTEAYIGNGIMDSDYGYSKGFDVYGVHHEEIWLRPFKRTVVGRLYRKLSAFIPSPFKAGRGTDSTEWCTAKLVERIPRLHGRAEPYFLWVHYMDPHTPLTPPLKYISGDPARKKSTGLSGWKRRSATTKKTSRFLTKIFSSNFTPPKSGT